MSILNQIRVINIIPSEWGEDCEGTRRKMSIMYPTAKDLEEETENVVVKYNRTHRTQIRLCSVVASFDRFNSPSYVGFFNILPKI